MSRIVYCLRNLWYFRLHASTIEELLKNGNEVHISVLGDDIASVKKDGLNGVFNRLDGLLNKYPNLYYDELKRRIDRWAVLNMVFNRLVDFFHFRRKIFKDKNILWERIKGPYFLQPYLNSKIWHNRFVVGIACRILRRLEKSLPPEFNTLKYFKRIKPDLIAFSPLTDTALSQFDQLRAAQVYGVPTAFIVNSWDNLSSKSWMRHKLTKVFIWNEIQKEEAKKIHGIKPGCIGITGTPSFDDIYSFKPQISRSQFFQDVGMDQDKPYLLYMGSAVFQRTKKPEKIFFEDWLAKIRNHSNENLRNIQIVVRPHPVRVKDWISVYEKNYEKVFFWPSDYEFPVHADTRMNYLHSIYYCSAMVGLNTSAFWEGAILGKPVLAVLDKRFKESQQQTVHFSYLCSENKGVVRAHEDLDSHFEELVKIIQGNGGQTEEERLYANSFLCPRASEGKASQILSQELMNMFELPIVKQKNKIVDRIIRKVILSPISYSIFKYYEGKRRLNKDLKLRSPAKPA